MVAVPAKAQPAATPTTAKPTPAPAAIKSSSPAVVAPATTARVVAAPSKTQPAATPATAKPTPAPAATESSSPPVKANPANEIATASGAIYKNVYVEKVEPDGIIISYTPTRGGVGMTKVYFDDLSAELRQRYGKKTAYEAK
jgi:hypothetical protein